MQAGALDLQHVEQFLEDQHTCFENDRHRWPAALNQTDRKKKLIHQTDRREPEQLNKSSKKSEWQKFVEDNVLGWRQAAERAQVCAARV